MAEHEMRLTRNITPDGRGKYAIVRLDKVRKITEIDKRNNPEPRGYSETLASRVHYALLMLEEIGILEYGEPGTEEECFVVKLKDKFAPRALQGYRSALWSAIGRETDKAMKESLLDYFDDLQTLEDRATSHPSRKRPD